MLQKNEKRRSGFLKFVAKGAKILFVAEVVAFGATYLVWHRLNTNRGKHKIARKIENQTSWLMGV